MSEPTAKNPGASPETLAKLASALQDKRATRPGHALGVAAALRARAERSEAEVKRWRDEVERLKAFERDNLRIRGEIADDLRAEVERLKAEVTRKEGWTCTRAACEREIASLRAALDTATRALREAMPSVYHDADGEGPHFTKRSCRRCRLDAALAEIEKGKR